MSMIVVTKKFINLEGFTLYRENMVMYKWLVMINGTEYVVNASNEETASSKCLKAYKKKHPNSQKMNPEIKRMVRIKNTTYTDLMTYDPNFVISIRKLGTVYKDGIF